MPTTTRDKLLDAATRLLDSGGPEAVTLREVGRLAGVSHNTPYKHFADKEDLLAEVAAGELGGLGAALRSLPPTGPESLRAALNLYTVWALDHPARFKLVFGSWRSESAVLGRAAAEARTALVVLVAGAQDRGLLPAGDTERAAALVHSLTHGAVDLSLAGHLSAEKGRTDPAGLVEDLLTYLGAAAG
ncbi:TetR/AcrR family transcriptional regulator [Nocardiopsis ganjiahuensis]|uniref:TetR/AcrR family transcriptional regulator n=1 Tax=Nocardiopsis ganjiahuensis TaxID=239984 RepID=UPI00034DE07E|nr:TetR/AcrR family transcriptional regulator [Nocardiopsis ganjiahuensis]